MSFFVCVTVVRRKCKPLLSSPLPYFTVDLLSCPSVVRRIFFLPPYVIVSTTAVNPGDAQSPPLTRTSCLTYPTKDGPFALLHLLRSLDFPTVPTLPLLPGHPLYFLGLFHRPRILTARVLPPYSHKIKIFR